MAEAEIERLFDGHKPGDDEKKAAIRAYKAEWYQKNKELTKNRSKERYKNNKHVIKIKRSEYSKKNRKKLSEASRAWKKANPDRVKENDARYRINNVENIAKSSKKWRESRLDECKRREAKRRIVNKEKNNARVKEWRENNPDKCRIQRHKRRARIANAEGTHTASDLAKIRNNQRDKCAYCRLSLNGGGHIDHIIPLSRGGSDWPKNLQWLCVPCNLSKSARDPIEFAQLKGKLL